jgi:hypothetical protein
MPTTAGQVAVTTGTAIKTMLQIKLGTETTRAKVVEWGISFNGSAAATPILCELLTTGTVAATVTAHAATGIQNRDPLAITPTDGEPFTISTTTTGFTSTGEGSIIATRMLDCQLIAPTNQYIFQAPLGREWAFSPLNYLRIRVTAGAAVNAICYIDVEV